MKDLEYEGEDMESIATGAHNLTPVKFGGLYEWTWHDWEHTRVGKRVRALEISEHI